MALAPPTPLVLAFAGGKGGIGKSTLTVSIAVEWHRRGLRVLVVDADDEQRSCLTWAEIADEKGVSRPEVIALGDDIRTELPRELERAQREGRPYDVVILDCPGRIGRRVTYAVGSSHVVVFPCAPSPFEIWAMDSSLKVVQDVREETGHKVDAAIVITAKQDNTVIGRQLRVILGDAPVPVMSTELRFSVDYKYAIGAGKGPTTHEPTCEAASDVRAFVRELEKRFNVSSRTTRSLWERISNQLKQGRKRVS